MRVLVCGSRDWKDKEPIFRELDNLNLPDNIIIIEGGQRGADQIAKEYGEFKGFTVETFAAEWTRLGHKAGPIRNQKMLDSGVDMVIAFPIGLSIGINDMIEKARKAHIATIVIFNVK